MACATGGKCCCTAKPAAEQTYICALCDQARPNYDTPVSGNVWLPGTPPLLRIGLPIHPRTSHHLGDVAPPAPTLPISVPPPQSV